MNFNKRENVELFDEFVRFLDLKYGITKTDFENLIKKKKGLTVPINIFDNKALSVLETTVKFLRENDGLKFCEMEKILGRDQRVLSVTYRNSIKKFQEKFSFESSELNIPLKIFLDKKYAPLESIVKYLKENIGLKFCKIAILLNRNPRTIWTVYNRQLKK